MIEATLLLLQVHPTDALSLAQRVIIYLVIVVQVPEEVTDRKPRAIGARNIGPLTTVTVESQ